VDILWISGEENFTGGVKKTSPGVVKKTSPRILSNKNPSKEPFRILSFFGGECVAVVRGLAEGKSVVSAE
jgi:hypothetical protein